MSLTLTPIVTDNFTPDANPLNPAKWTAFTGLGTLKAVSAACSAGDLVSIDAEYYSGHGAFPNDQYLTVTIPSALVVGSGASFTMILRAPVDASAGYSVSFTEAGSAGKLNIIAGDNGTTVITINNRAYSVGDNFTFAVVGTSLFVLQNGTQIGTGTLNTASSGVLGLLVAPLVALTDVTVSNFIAGSASIASTPYSVPDCRNFATFPNASRTINATKTYDVQTSSNHAVPGTDSRAAGAPVDSSTQPQNSRAPGTYGPGE